MQRRTEYDEDTRVEEEVELEYGTNFLRGRDDNMAIGITQDGNTENWPEMTEKGSTKPGFG